MLVTNTATASFVSRAGRLDVPTVYFCHGLHWNLGNRMSERVWQALELWALRSTDGVIVINDDDEKWFRDKASTLPIKRMHAGVGVPIDRYPRRPYPAMDKVRLVWVGEFSARKRPFLALDVMERLVERTPSASLKMFGQGPLHAGVVAEIERRKLSAHVSAPGKTSAVPNELENAHGLLHTATWEGLPRVGLESLAVGRPVFAFDVKGVRSLPVVNSVRDGDSVALAQMIANYEWNKEAARLPQPDSLDSARVADDILDFLPEAIRAKSAG